MQPEYVGTITNLPIVLNTHKNPYLNQATQKTTCQNFPIQEIPKSNISNPKKSFDHPCHLKSEETCSNTVPFSLTHRATSISVTSGCKESQFYSLLFGLAVASMY